MLWDMHLCVFDVRLSFENRVPKIHLMSNCKQCFSSTLAKRKHSGFFDTVRRTCFKWEHMMPKVYFHFITRTDGFIIH